MAETLTATLTLEFTNSLLPSRTITETVTLNGGHAIREFRSVASGGSSPSWNTELLYDRGNSNLPSLNGNDPAFLYIECVEGEPGDDITYVEIQAVDDAASAVTNMFTFELKAGQWLLFLNGKARISENGDDYGSGNGGVFLDAGGSALVVHEIAKIYGQNKSAGTAAKFLVMAGN